jgi:DNA-binding LacI/PurR family transcriptional regulator
MAKGLSLSVCTVSKALNGRPGVREQTRQRVLSAASRFGYVPDRQAQMLRHGRSRCIGLLLPTLANPVYSERMEDIYQAAEDRGYEVLVTSFEQSVDRKIRLCREMIGRRVEAVMLAGGWAGVPLQSLIDAGIVVLLVNPGEERAPGAAVLQVNRAEGVRQLVGHLLELGHRRPLLMGNWLNDAQRMAGVRKGLSEAGMAEDDFEASEAVFKDKMMEKAYEQTLEAFMKGHEATTAVMASNDQVAIGVIAALDHWGLSVPEEVSVTGMDNINASRFCRPALTTMSQTHLSLGRRAIEMVVSILEGQSPRDVYQELAPQLVVRDSTGAARARHSYQKSMTCVV